MKLAVVAVGRVRGDLAGPIADYEGRIRRYFPLEVAEVREEPATRGRSPEEIMHREGERLLARVPAGLEVVALDRRGAAWSSEELARFVERMATHGAPGAAFVIGGALGLSPGVLARARHRFSLSALTLPHELARLVLTEQLYRACTILRGEPYHKGTGG